MKGFLPLEAHFVHSDTKGHLAVLAVMFDVGEENEALQHIIDQAPADKNQTLPLDKMIDIASSFSTSKHYYRFSGSLTPPPPFLHNNLTVLNRCLAQPITAPPSR